MSATRSCGDVAGRVVHDRTAAQFSFCLFLKGGNDVLGAGGGWRNASSLQEGDSSVMRSKRVRSAWRRGPGLYSVT